MLVIRYDILLLLNGFKYKLLNKQLNKLSTVNWLTQTYSLARMTNQKIMNNPVRVLISKVKIIKEQVII